MIQYQPRAWLSPWRAAPGSIGVDHTTDRLLEIFWAYCAAASFALFRRDSNSYMAWPDRAP